MTLTAMSGLAASSRARSRFPAAESRSHSEKWSVSRTSNLFFVGLLLSILASQPRRFFEIWIVLEHAVGSPGIFYSGAYLSDPLLQLFDPLFERLRHNMKILHRLEHFHKEDRRRQFDVRAERNQF